MEKLKESINQVETKLLQYTDDTTAVLFNLEFAQFNSSSCSGLKVNGWKTERLWIGSLKDNEM